MTNSEALVIPLEAVGLDMRYDPQDGGYYAQCSLCDEIGAYVLVDTSTSPRAFCPTHAPVSVSLFAMAEFCMMTMVRFGRVVRRRDYPDGWTHFQWSGPEGRFTPDQDLAWEKSPREYEGGGDPP